MAVGRHEDLISTSGSDEATIMTKPSIDRKPSSDVDSWSAAVVTLHHDFQDVLDGNDTATNMPPPLPLPTPTPIMSSEKLPMEEAKPLPPAPYVVPGERSKAVSSKKNVGEVPSTAVSKNAVKNKKKAKKMHVKSTRQPRPLSPVADTLLGQPSASFSSSMHETDDAMQLKMKKESSITTPNVTVTTAKKPPPPETPSYIYIEHEVLPTDTLQGVCLAYKISATRLRMENKFSGNSLILAPKILKIPIDPAKMKSLGTVEDVVRRDKVKGGLEKEEEKEVATSKDDQGVTEEEDEENVPWLIKSASTAAEEEKEDEKSTFFDIDSSKRLLRELMESLSVQVDVHGESVITTSEYNFLQMLLESNGPGVAEACVAAHGRLMDADLFWGTIGGGGGDAPAEELRLEEENNEMITPSAADSGVYSCVSDLLSVGTSIVPMEGLDPLQYNPQYDADLGVFSDVGRDEKEGGDYKEIFVASSSGGGRDEKKGSDYGDSSIAGVPPVPRAVEETPPANNYLDSSTKERLDRLEQRRQQSNRLLQAHEAGLVVTPGGSARRSLMRMGLPMGENLRNAPPPPMMPLSPIQDEGQSKSVSDCSTEDAERQAVDEILCNLSDAVKIEDGDETIIEQATFEKALAKMDERTLRRIKKEEEKKEAREKKKKGNIWSKETETAVARPAAPQHYAGCISPFSIGMLRRHFASKQFSIQRASSNSSSYTRFDSFLLSATETMESGFLLRRGDGYDDDDSFLDDTIDTGLLNDSIHAKKTKTSDGDRLDNLLINAGFKNTKSYDTTDTLVAHAQPLVVDAVPLVVDAQPEDDEDILAMSARSTNSIAMLMRGGPSYRNVDMFRADGDAEDEEKNEIPDDAKKSETSIQATKLSPSDAAADNGIREDPIDDDASDDDVSIPSLHSDLGELPSLLPPLAPVDRLSQSARIPRRRATIGIIKSASDKNNTKKYKRSVSWNRRVFAKEDAKVASMGLTRQDSAVSGMSVISFPNLAMSLPILRSESNVSESMTSVLSPIPPLSHAHSIHSTRGSFSVASATGPPLLCHAHSIRSDFGAAMTENIDDFSLDSEEDIDANPSRPDGAAWQSPIVSLKNKMKGSPTRPDKTNFVGGEDEDEQHPVFIHPTSKTRVYEGAGIEIEDFPQVAMVVPAIETMDSISHEKYQNMVSIIDDSVRSARSTYRFDDSFRSARSTNRFDDSVRSSRSLAQRLDNSVRSARTQRLDNSVRSARTNNNSWSWNNRFLRDDSIRSSSVRGLSQSGRSRRSSYNPRTGAPPITSLDDGFIIKNIHFERHSSEILRSLSNEDLVHSHRLERINGGLIHEGNPNEARSTRATSDMLSNAESWDGLEGSPSYQMMSDSAWPVLEEDYAEDCEALGPLSFRILGTSANDKDCQPHVLSPPLMESLQNFIPPALSFTNFWLKYSLVRDGPSLPSLLRHVRSSRHTFVAIETVGGEVFGSFTSSPWRKDSSPSGADSGDLDGNKLEEAFLWKMRRTRAAKDAQISVLDQAKLESELDVYYWTGNNNSQIQYCTQNVLAVGGGGPLRDGHDDGDDDGTENAKEERELHSKATADGAGGFGLAIESDLQRGTSSSCAAFRNPPLSAFHADGSPFEILNVEVWTMTPCANIADAEYLEMRDLFLEG